MMSSTFLLLVTTSAIAPALATVGVDTSTLISESAFTCLQTPGGQGAIQFAVPRVYRSNGSVDANGVQTVKNARASGIKYVDGYIFPCFPCGNPGKQITDAKNALDAAGAQFGMLWLDIEQYAWSSNKTANEVFITSMIKTGKSLGISLGIYSGYYGWVEIVSSSYTYPHAQGLPVWYAHYDGKQSFSDWDTTERGGYGGWTTPSIKQFLGDKTSCGVGIDYDWYPSSEGRPYFYDDGNATATTTAM